MGHARSSPIFLLRRRKAAQRSLQPGPGDKFPRLAEKALLVGNDALQGVCVTPAGLPGARRESETPEQLLNSELWKALQGSRLAGRNLTCLSPGRRHSSSSSRWRRILGLTARRWSSRGLAEVLGEDGKTWSGQECWRGQEPHRKTDRDNQPRPICLL